MFHTVINPDQKISYGVLRTAIFFKTLKNLQQ
jgi:hypothetical protein